MKKMVSNTSLGGCRKVERTNLSGSPGGAWMSGFKQSVVGRGA